VVAVTVTRQRLIAPPAREAAAHGREASAAPVVSREAPAVEARQVRDRLRVIGFFAGRAGQPLDVVQVVAATRLSAARALEAIDALVVAGWLERVGLRRTPSGHVKTWIRLDPEGGNQSAS
jgi:hypothetical protein